MHSSFYDIWNPFLEKYNFYYRELTEKGKIRFIKRAESIYENVSIVAKEGLEINDEVRILVIADLVQLTFGLKEFWLYGYEYIYLYPEAFLDKSSAEPVQGSTYQNTIISLSWRDVALDHLKKKDGKNVSLAQFGLALVRTVMNGKTYDIHFGSYLDRWFEIIRKECYAKTVGSGLEQLNQRQDDIAYVFSQAVELFFEMPETFKKELPTSYAHLCLLMNQDPLNFTEDYQYSRERLNKSNVLAPLPKMVVNNYKYKNWHWAYNFPFFGITLSPLFLYFIFDSLLIPPSQVITTIIMSGLIIGIFSYPYFKQVGLFRNRWLLVLCSLTGYSPCLVTFFLLVNQMHGMEFTAEKSNHSIASYYYTPTVYNGNIIQSITFNFHDQYLIDFPKARTFEMIEKPPSHPITLYKEVSYEIRNGLIGLPIIINREIN